MPSIQLELVSFLLFTILCANDWVGTIVFTRLQHPLRAKLEAYSSLYPKHLCNSRYTAGVPEMSNGFNGPINDGVSSLN